jgi:hypothetical protein
MAWIKSEAVAPGSDGQAGGMAAWPRSAQHGEIALRAAYWKYVVRRRIEGGKRGSFALKGSNFFARPEPGANIEAAWNADKRVLEREHRQLRLAIEKLRGTPRWEKLPPKLWGIAFHDIYHAGQIRLLRRLNTRK